MNLLLTEESFWFLDGFSPLFLVFKVEAGEGERRAFVLMFSKGSPQESAKRMGNFVEIENKDYISNVLKFLGSSDENRSV